LAALIAVETVVIVLLVVLVAGLLRSHADILKALHDLGVGVEDAPGHGHDRPASFGPVTVDAPTRRAEAAPDVAGLTPAGDAVALSVTASHDTLLAFLTSGCTACLAIWDALRSERLEAPGGARVVAVTRGDDLESPAKVAELAEGVTVPVVRSSEVWEAYQVPGAPYFVHVEARSGRVIGEGTAQGWDQVVGLMERARAESGDAGVRAAAELERDAVARRRLRAMASDRAREERADEELLAAGIGPGDPRLSFPVEEADGRGESEAEWG